MTKPQWTRLRRLFEEGLERPLGERDAWVASACAGDVELLAELRRLFTAHATSGDFLTAPDPERVTSTLGLAPGTRVGRYEIRGILAAGGMGTVYEAVQEQPQRTVALKMLPAGLRDATARRRFHYEVEVLGRLNHPAIAQVYEAGTVDEGDAALPWFAMELVPRATTLLEHASERGLDIRQRLSLFVEVCDAIHYGHQRGVIHRDVKPGNILVDGAGRPKVIDFGIARPAPAGSAEIGDLTDPGHVVGTLRYMSPEQLDARELDTRADVFSLGVVLYELLAGRSPWGGDESSLAALVCDIREAAPPPLRTLRHDFAVELDWIVGRALEKEPDRRYASASELSADLQRFLADEPVAAGPPSATYRLRSFVRRHRLPVGLAATALALLVLGSAGTTWGWLETRRALEFARGETRRAEAEARRAQEARAEAEAAAGEADRARARAEDEAARADAARDVAEAETARASAAIDFLTDTLTASHPHRDGRDVRVVELLERGRDRLRDDPPEHAAVRATLQHAFGVAYQGLGLPLEAEPLLAEAAEGWERLHGVGARDALDARNALNLALVEGAQLERAAVAVDAMLDSTREHLPPGDPVSMSAMRNRARLLVTMGDFARGLDQQRELLEALGRHTPGERRQIAQCRAEMAFSLLQLQRFDEALPLLEEVTAELAEHDDRADPVRLGALATLGTALYQTGATDRAIEVLQEAYDLQTTVGGLDSSTSLRIANQLTTALKRAGRAEDAIAVIEGARRIATDVLGADNLTTLVLGNNLALVLTELGRIDEARDVYRDIVDAATGGPLERHPLLAVVQLNLGDALQRLGDRERAAESFRRVITLNRGGPSELHPLSLTTALEQLALILLDDGEAVEAERLLREAHGRRAASEGATAGPTLASFGGVARALALQGRFDEGEAIWREIHDGALARGGWRHESTLRGALGLATILAMAGKREEAAALVEVATPHARAALGSDHETTRRLVEMAGETGDA